MNLVHLWFGPQVQVLPCPGPEPHQQVQVQDQTVASLHTLLPDLYCIVR